jgi:aminoglycoside 3-N-acetyltransferase I
VNVRRLGPGDEHVVAALATRAPSGTESELLADDRTIFLVAFDDDVPVGLVLGHELPRRHAPRSKLFVYEVDVVRTHRRRGVAAALFAELDRIARERRIPSGFVLTDRDNEPAMALYESVGGRDEQDVVQWTFGYTDA